MGVRLLSWYEGLSVLLLFSPASSSSGGWGTTLMLATHVASHFVVTCGALLSLVSFTFRFFLRLWRFLLTLRRVASVCVSTSFLRTFCVLLCCNMKENNTDRDTGRASSEGWGIDWKSCLNISNVGWWFSHILFISIRVLEDLIRCWKQSVITCFVFLRPPTALTGEMLWWWLGECQCYGVTLCWCGRSLISHYCVPQLPLLIITIVGSLQIMSMICKATDYQILFILLTKYRI